MGNRTTRFLGLAALAIILAALAWWLWLRPAPPASSLLDVLYLPNRHGGGQRMWVWEVTGPRIQTAYGVDVLLKNNETPVLPSAYKCLAAGGPYADFQTRGLMLYDAGWQEAESYNFVVWAWVNADTLDGNDRTIVSKWDEAAGRRSWLLYWDEAQGKFAFAVSPDGTAVVDVHSSLAGVTGTWYFVAGFIQPSTLMRIYAGAATDRSLTVDTNRVGIPAGCHDDVAGFFVGAMNESGGGYDEWDGKIGVNSGWLAISEANVDDYLNFVFAQTKHLYLE